MSFSKLTTATVALALITLAIAGVAAIGAAEDSDWDELDNSTFETTNDTEYVEFDLETAETFENTAEENVELTIYDEAEYNDSEVDEQPVIEDSVTLEPNETYTEEFDLSDTDLEAETEYRAIVDVEYDADHIVSGYVAADDESIGGVQFGDGDDAVPGFGAGVAVAGAAIALAGLVARGRRGS